jgi:hypothetical protein
LTFSRQIEKLRQKKRNRAQGQINDPGTQLNGTSQINDKLRLTKKNNNRKSGAESQLTSNKMLDPTRTEEIFKKMKGKNWCFTLAHPSIQEMDEIKAKIEEENDKLVKAIVGIERGSNEQFEHLQGYLAFTINYSGWQMKRIWSERAHWERAKSTAKKNFEYCSKERNILTQKGFEAIVERIEKEEKNKEYWASVINDAMKLTPAAFAEAHPREWLLRRNAIERLMLESSKKRMRAWDGKLRNKNVWIWGAPGVGKSRWADSLQVTGETFRKNFNKWWCGMETRTVRKVIIEDWPARPQGDMLAQHLKIWADRYCFCAETKGSSVPVMPGRFFLIITSNFQIEDCFGRREDVGAIKRRFTELEMTLENQKLVARLRLDEGILGKLEEDEEDEEIEKEEPMTLEELMDAMGNLTPGEEVEEDDEW